MTCSSGPQPAVIGSNVHAIRNFHPAKLRFVFVKRRCADAVLPANFRSRHPSFLLLNHANNLFVAEP